MAEYCKNCKELQDRLDKIAASRQSRSKALLAAGDQLVKRLEHIMEFCGTLSMKARCDIGRELERWDSEIAANANLTGKQKPGKEVTNV